MPQGLGHYIYELNEIYVMILKKKEKKKRETKYPCIYGK